MLRRITTLLPFAATLALSIGPGKTGLCEAKRTVSNSPWKFIPGTAPGGEAGGAKAKAGGPQLYNLSSDIGETKNFAAEEPDVVAEMREQLRKVREAERSRP
jgi:hypothetical protein